MNTLSWMIYAADVVGKLGGAAGLVAFFALFGGAVAAITYLAPWSRYSWDRDDAAWNSKMEMKNRLGTYAGRMFALAAFAGLVAVATPSAQTVYLIAASEAGETVVTSPDAIEMMNDLKAVIKKRLKSELAE